MNAADCFDDPFDDVFDVPIGRIRRRLPPLGERDKVSRGSSTGIVFRLEWQSEPEVVGSLDFSFFRSDCELEVILSMRRLATEPVWVGFLETMARTWSRLLLQEGRGVIVPEGAFVSAMGDERDIARWFGASAFTGSFLLVREGNEMVVESQGYSRRGSFADVLRTLEYLGDAVAARMERWSRSSASHRAVAAWRSRDNGRTLREETILSLGMPRERAEGLLEQGVIPMPTNRNELIRGLDEIRAAARMAQGVLGDADLRRLVGWIARVEMMPAPSLDNLDCLSQKVWPVLDQHEGKPPFEQGYALAASLREQLRQDARQPFDLVGVLRDWAVPIHLVDIDRRVEAISVWGARHGPAILLNKWEGSPSVGSDMSVNVNLPERLPGRVRATLAHEICHLLVDRGISLPAAEVCGGTVPEVPEQRARAFAAELLAPKMILRDIYAQASGVEQALEAMTRHFSAGRQLVARQLLNEFPESSPLLPLLDREYLEQIAKS